MILRNEKNGNGYLLTLREFLPIYFILTSDVFTWLWHIRIAARNGQEKRLHFLQNVCSGDL